MQTSPVTQVDLMHNGHVETWWVGQDGVIRLEGLVQPGIYLFDSKSRRLYVKHPEEEKWVKVSFDAVQRNLPFVEAAKEGEWQEQYGVMSERWRVFNGSLVCGHWFTNVRAQAISGIDASTMVQIRNAIDYLYFGRTAPTCEQINLPAALGKAMGLPMYWDGPWGTGEVSRVVATEAEVIPVPVGSRIKALTKEVHVRFLTRSLPLNTRQTLQQGFENLPLVPQHKALEHLLRAQRAVEAP